MTPRSAALHSTTHSEQGEEGRWARPTAGKERRRRSISPFRKKWGDTSHARDGTTCEWGASPLNGDKSGKWARPTCLKGLIASASLRRLVEVGDKKVGQQKEQENRHGHDQNNREPGPPASPGGAIHRLLHEHVLPLLRTG